MRNFEFLTARVGWLIAGQTPSLASPAMLYGTTDGGARWVRISSSPLPGAIGYSGLGRLAFANTQTGWAVANAGAGACQASFVVDRTTDGGVRWQSLARIRGSDGPVALAVSTTGSTLWLANASCAAPSTVVWTSSNGGKSWTPGTHPVLGPRAALGGGPLANTLAASPSGPTLITAYEMNQANGQPAGKVELQITDLATGASVLRATPVPRNVPILSLSFISARQGWLLTASGKVYQTVNGAKTWSRISTPKQALTGPYPVAALTASSQGWYSTGQRLWKTTNDGRHWVAMSMP